VTSHLALGHAAARLADSGDGGGHSAGGWGFLVVLALIVVSVLLFIAMRRSLSKVPESFDPPNDPADDTGTTDRP
jgi:hypothetical protein